MGWDFAKGMKKEDLIAEVVSDYRAVKHAVKFEDRQSVLWILTEDRVILCVLLSKEAGYGWGYKVMCEAMGPYYYSCPLSFLDSAPVANGLWRETVKQTHSLAKVS